MESPKRSNKQDERRDSTVAIYNQVYGLSEVVPRTSIAGYLHSLFLKERYLHIERDYFTFT